MSQKKQTLNIQSVKKQTNYCQKQKMPFKSKLEEKKSEHITL